MSGKKNLSDYESFSFQIYYKQIINENYFMYYVTPFLRVYILVTQRFRVVYIEDITRRWREDMNFMFEWQKRYLTSERSERVRCRFCHENIKFISLSHRVIFFLLYGDQM